jgi:AbrB family looped-hinge helix DNA binding protein
LEFAKRNEVMKMKTAYVNSKGQLVIPVKVRRKFGIKPGTKICFVERDHEVLFQPVTKEYIRNLCGMLKSTRSVTTDLLKERRLGQQREKKFAERRTR